MNDIKATITEQLQQLQMLMHRAYFHDFFGGAHNPHRGQGRVLAILKLKPEISQKELTYLLNMSKQSLAELLAKLEKSGYITREQSEDDPRSKIIKLTEAGARTAGDMDDAVSDTGKILECLTDEELNNLSGYLARIIKRYEEQFPDDDYEERHKMMEQFMSQHGHGHGRNFDDHGDCHHDMGGHFGGGWHRG